MKNLLLLLIIALLGFGTFAQSGWQPLSSNYSNPLNDVVAFNDSVVVCVGGSATAGDGVYSFDGGNSFTTQTVSTSMLNTVAVTSVGLYVAGNQGKIYYTTDGVTFSSQTSGTTTDLYDLHFPTATTGYAVGASGVVIKTANGSTWSNPIISGGTTYSVNAVFFTSTTDGVIGGDYNFIQGFIARTVSSASYFGAPTTTISKVNDIFFTSGNIGFAVGESGNIFKTTNGGAGWTTASSGTTTNLNAIHFYDASYGYIVGDGGLILRTTDGGITWNTQNSGVTANLNGVYCPDSNIAFAVGDNGTILRTLTGGSYLAVNVDDDTVYCNGYANLKAQTAYSGNGTLTYSWASSPYLSSTNDSITTAGPLQNNQTFYVTVTDGALSASDSATVIVSALPTDSICLVTVDDSLGYNVVVFEKRVLGSIHHYNIYSESSVSGVYDSIGFIPADSVGVFVDTNSNPAVKAYSYKISNIDSCGNESMMSDLHKTMHLTINQGTGSSWNLIWNPYVGVPVQTYRIWRADASLTWTKIDSVPGGNTSFTDLTPPTGRLYYQVEIISPYICQPFNYKANTNYNTSRSNTASIPPPPFHASFSASPAFGIAPLTVQFTDLSSGFINDYLWDFGDGNTSTLANPNHTYTQAGLYSVKLKVIGDTEEDSITMVDMIEVDPNGIQTINVGFEMEMYPNPVQGNQQLVIKHPSTLVSKIHVYDILGKAVPFTSATSPQQSELSFDEIAEGIYFVKVSDQNGNYELRKLVVK